MVSTPPLPRLVVRADSAIVERAIRGCFSESLIIEELVIVMARFGYILGAVLAGGTPDFAFRYRVDAFYPHCRARKLGW